MSGRVVLVVRTVAAAMAAALLAVVGVPAAWADAPLSPGAVSTVAGSGQYLTVDGVGTTASLKSPAGVVLVGGALYVSTVDAIRRVDTATKAVTTLAGGGTSGACGWDSSLASDVTFGSVGPMATDGTSLFTVINCGGAVVLRSTSLATGATVTLGGLPLNSSWGYLSSIAYAGGFVYAAAGGSIVKFNVATHASATFASEPSGAVFASLTVDATSLWAVAVDGSYSTRLESVSLTTGVVSPLGSMLPFASGGPGGTSIADAGAYLFVSYAHLIRRYTKADGTFVDVAGAGIDDRDLVDGTGTDAWLSNLSAMVYDGAGLWITDLNVVRRIVSAAALPSAQSLSASTSVTMSVAEVHTVTTHAGSGDVDGPYTSASISSAFGMVTVGQVVYVLTWSGLRTYNMVTGMVGTLVPGGPSNNCGSDGSSGATSTLRYGTSLTTDGYYLYMGDQCGAIRRVSIATGAVSTVGVPAGSTITGALAMGPDGFLYLAGRSLTNTPAYDTNIYRINPRTGVGTVFASEVGAYRLRAMTADTNALWVSVQMPCPGGSCGPMNRLDRIDLGTGAISTLVSDPPPSGVGMNAPYGAALVSAGNYLYAEHYSDLVAYNKTTGAWSEVAGTYDPNHGIVPPIDGYGSQVQISSILSLASDGKDIWFVDNPGYLRLAISAPSPLPAGATDPVSVAGGGSKDAHDCQCAAGDPVNTATGEMWESYTDVSLPGRVPVVWSRTFSSVKAGTDSPMGFGWAGPFTAKLTPGATGADPVVVTTENGATTTFTPTSTVAVFSAPPRVHAQLSLDPVSGNWTYTRASGQSMVFRADGRLVSQSDRNGEKITLAYTTASPPQLSSVTAPDGRALTITYNAAVRIWKVTGPSATGVAARVATYVYDAAGNLKTVTDSRGKVWTYGYDGSHRVTTVTSPAGGITTTHYDATGRADLQSDPRSKTTTFAYTDTTVGTDLHRTTRVTDPSGVVSDDEYVNGWLTAKTIAPGTAGASRWTYGYDIAGNQTTATDPTGVVTTSTFDSAGNRLTATVASGATMADGSVPGKLTTTWTYNGFNEPLTQTDTNSGSTTWTYDASGNVLTQAQKLNYYETAITTWTRTDPTHPGDVASTTDPRGNVTSFTYTPEGFVSSVTKPAGKVTDTTDTTVRTTATYTPYGEVLTSVEPRGNITGATAASYTTTNTYDTGGLQLTSKSPLGLTTTYTYDGDRRRVTVKNPGGKIWTTAYLPDGHIDTVTDPLGHVTTKNTYDDAGRVTSVTDATGRITATAYDDHGRPASATRPTGNVSGASAAVKAANTTSYGYDLAGRLTTTSTPDPSGGAALVTTTTYDGAGRAWKSTDPAAQTSITGYDNSNRVVALTDPAGDLTRYSYDYAGRRTAVTDPRNNTTSTWYDLAGNVVTVADPLTTTTSPSGRTTTQTWDAAGRLASVVDPRGNATGAVASNYTTTYTYDPAGNLRIVTDNLAHTTKTTYDRDGRVATHVTGKNRTTTNTYDTTGRLWKITAPDAGVTVYGYDAANRRTTVSAPMLGVWGSGYDDAGRLTSQTDPAGVVRSYAYTPDGQLQTVTSPRGTATRGYNPLGQLTSLTYSDTTPPVAYAYDRAGRRATMTDTAGTLAYTYDPASRPTAITRTPTSGPVTTWGYAYDANGNITTRTRPDTSSETWTYDAANQATAVSDPTGSTTWTYDDAGNPLVTTMPNGTTETRTWDRAGALASIATKKATTVLTSQTVTRDAVNQPTKTVVVRNAATETRSYLYDTNERITDVCYAATCTAATATQHWTYDKNGNRLTEQNGVTPGVVTTRTYDTTDRITSTKVGTGATLVPTYDADGNLTADGTGTTTSYRLDGLTATTTTGAATTSYTYDGDGTRLTATTTGTGATSTYTWDPNQSLPSLAQVVTDPDGTGPTAATTTVNRYDPLGMPLSVTAAGATAFVAHDPLGSVTDLTNTTGAIARSADYTPYGSPRTPIGAPATPSGPVSVLGFTGALTDPNGQIYLHARQYDPAAGQFSTRDPMGLVASSGYGHWFGNTYGYVAGRVTIDADPSGQLSGSKCVSLGGGWFLGGFAQWCPVSVYYDDRTGDVSVGGTETVGGGPFISEVPTVGLAAPFQVSTARNPDQSGGLFAYAGGSARVGPGVTGGVFFGPSEGANCNFVVGAEFGPTLGPPVLEGHSGASNTWNQTYFTLGRDNPLRLLAPLLFLL